MVSCSVTELDGSAHRLRTERSTSGNCEKAGGIGSAKDRSGKEAARIRGKRARPAEGSARISGAALKKVAVVLSQFPESKVTVEGYTDSKGAKATNMQLSRERAQSVKDWLVKNGGVVAGIISTKGYGEQNAIAPNTNPDGTDNPLGRALNRRVSIIVEKPATVPAP